MLSLMQTNTILVNITFIKALQIYPYKFSKKGKQNASAASLCLIVLNYVEDSLACHLSLFGA